MPTFQEYAVSTFVMNVLHERKGELVKGLQVGRS